MNESTKQATRRRFLKVVTSLAGIVGVVGAAFPFLRTMLPSARARAIGAPLEMDLDGMQPGQIKTGLWRGRPIAVLRRTEAMLHTLKETEGRLLDHETTQEWQPEYIEERSRAVNSEYLVVEASCTHLNCIPHLLPERGNALVGDWWPGGFFCPCHRSAYDYAGRVVQGPAPRNLRVPPYRFDSKTVIIVGEDPERT